MTDTAYRAIIEAARSRFGQDGYRYVTIRSIAADAGYSPAMVMKVVGSKERLFSLATPTEVPPDTGEGDRVALPKEQIGYELVRRVFSRRRMGAGDPYAVTPVLIRSAPEPDKLRADIRERYLGNMAGMIGDTTADLRHAKAVVALLFGIAAAVHTLQAYEDADDDEAITTFAPLVQAVVDRCAGPRTPLPDESVGITAARPGTDG